MPLPMVDGELPALQVIVLGSGGGPREDNTTAFLVRSTAQQWAKGSLLAVDAGVQLSSITKILDSHPPLDGERPIALTEGPFAGLKIPYTSSAANAAHITRHLVDTYLITHPHLDHISGFVINTASLSGSRPKRLAGLPPTISAFKSHIFNNIIWPNLSDENNGAGLVTYMRLVEGGSPALGNGDGKGYVELCEGLGVKTWGISHGHCIEKHSHRGSNASLHGHANLDGTGPSHADASPMRRSISHESRSPNYQRPRAGSLLNYNAGSVFQVFEQKEEKCVYDSSAHFIRDIATGKEVVIFGDVEPDSLSFDPRNKRLWTEAAPRIAAGNLGAIFIECSYDDSQDDSVLFGHLAPRHLISELKSLATEVTTFKTNQHDKDTKKRKRMSNGGLTEPQYRRRSPRSTVRHESPSSRSSPVSPLSQSRETQLETDYPPLPITAFYESQPLKGLKVVIIHVKEKLDDGPDEGAIILKQLLEYEEEAALGCEFIISKAGQSVYV